MLPPPQRLAPPDRAAHPNSEIGSGNFRKNSGSPILEFPFRGRATVRGRSNVRQPRSAQSPNSADGPTKTGIKTGKNRNSGFTTRRSLSHFLTYSPAHRRPPLLHRRPPPHADGRMAAGRR